MKTLLRYTLWAIIAIAVNVSVADAGMRDTYLEAARKYRESARYESDPVLREGYLHQAEEMERNARSLESDAPIFRGDQIQDELNRQLRNIESQSRSNSNSSSSTCAGRVCAKSYR
jgi:hypothetical protein